MTITPDRCPICDTLHWVCGAESQPAGTPVGTDIPVVTQTVDPARQARRDADAAGVT